MKNEGETMAQKRGIHNGKSSFEWIKENKYRKIDNFPVSIDSLRFSFPHTLSLTFPMDGSNVDGRIVLYVIQMLMTYTAFLFQLCQRFNIEPFLHVFIFQIDWIEFSRPTFALSIQKIINVTHDLQTVNICKAYFVW